MTRPQARQLVVRVNSRNPNHHLWNNHGTWWIHYSVLMDARYQARRVRASLDTPCLHQARRRRDELLARLAGEVLTPLAPNPSERLR